MCLFDFRTNSTPATIESLLTHLPRAWDRARSELSRKPQSLIYSNGIVLFECIHWFQLHFQNCHVIILDQFDWIGLIVSSKLFLSLLITIKVLGKGISCNSYFEKANALRFNYSNLQWMSAGMIESAKKFLGNT